MERKKIYNPNSYESLNDRRVFGGNPHGILNFTKASTTFLISFLVFSDCKSKLEVTLSVEFDKWTVPKFKTFIFSVFSGTFCVEQLVNIKIVKIRYKFFIFLISFLLRVVFGSISANTQIYTIITII